MPITATDTIKKDHKLNELYWVKKIKGLPIQPSLCNLGIRNLGSGEVVKDCSIAVSSQTKILLDKVSTGSDKSKYVLFLSALCITYHRYFQLDEVIISTPGFLPEDNKDANFINFVKVIFDQNDTALSIIQKVQQEIFEIEGKEIYDIDHLFKKSAALSEAREKGAFNLLFNYHLAGKDCDVPESCEVAFHCNTNDEAIVFSLKASESDRTLVTQFVQHWLTVLEKMLGNVHTEVSSISFLSDDEISLMTKRPNDTVLSYDTDKSVIELLEKAVDAHSASTALHCNGKKFTYDQLNQRINHLANKLIGDHGISKGDYVAISVERTEWLAIGLLAIVKTGAAFVPIDLNNPIERTKFIVSDCKAKLILTDGAYEKEEFSCQKINIQNVGGEDTGNPQTSSLPQDIIYVIYTSGSTGTPKGVLQTHECISNLIQWQVNNEHFSRGLKVLQWSSIGFDACIHEILFALLSGGQVELIDEDTRRDPMKLGEYIYDNEIEVFWQTSSALNVLFEISDKANKAKKIKHIISTGEQLLIGNALRNFLVASPQVKLHNFYGPTETHVTTSNTICNNEEVNVSYQPIGEPLPNTRALILDKNFEFSPIGVEGDLYVAGACLAAGYLNNAELTSQKFRNIPKYEFPVLYQTGDRCRWLPNGKIEYLGRIDDQVKIRGQRVETGEVESLLMQIEAVKEVAVVAKKDSEEHYFLAAYYISAAEYDKEKFEEYLKSKVPDYFIPSYFIKKSSLPLTSSGKINKKALKDEEIGLLDYDEENVLAQNPLQEKLSELWQVVLNRQEPVGIKSNFFRVGGHSLKATRLVSAIYKEFSINITLRNIFEKPTIEEQALLISNMDNITYESIEKSLPQLNYELSHAQKRLWVIDQFEEKQVAYNMPGVFTLSGKIDLKAFEKALNTIVARHEILRTTFILVDGEPRQRIQPIENFPFALKIVDLNEFDDKTNLLKTFLEDESITSFELNKGPLIRARLVKLEDEKHVLLLTVHHIICDGWSQDILIKEIVTLYNAYSQGLANPLEPLKIQYKDYAIWQNKQLEESKLQVHEQYWLNNLKGEVPVLDLVADQPRPQYQTFNGDFVVFEIDETLSSKLYNLARENDSTLFMVLLSAVNILFNRYTGQEDIIIGTPIAGRQHIELDDQIGLYVNTLALRTQFNSEDSFISLLEKVKNVTLNAYEHQIYPFDLLIDKLDVPRQMNRNPLFDVMVALQNANESTTGLPSMDNITVESSGVKDDASKFDIWISFSELEPGIAVMIQYNTDLFYEERMKRFSTHLKLILEALVSTPSQSISKLDYFHKEEKQQILQEFNQTKFPFPDTETVVSLFENIAEKTPDAIALSVNDKQFTYSQFSENCNKIAHYVRTHFNIVAGDALGVVFEDPELKIIAVWSILKAGAAYVPIDPQYPSARIQYIINDSDVKGILTEKALKDRIEELDNKGVLILDELDYLGFEAQNPTRITNCDDLMYIIYTSGSTGNPKGCELNHKGVVNRISWMWRNYDLTSDDVILQKTPLIFDVSVWEVFMPLCFGARMVACKTADILFEDSMRSLIEKEKITTIHFVPSIFEGFVASLDSSNVQKCKSLKRIILSGEALSINLAKEFQSKLDIPLHNLYGPTEASVDVTSYEVPSNPVEILIGKPIDNIQMYILDKELQPVPIGIEGELFIGGVGLAKGYRNNEALTLEKFIANPFNPEERLYRTGDIGLWISQGNIKYIGRTDDQVKIRGQRVELSEIEEVLNLHDNIEKTIVKVYNNDLENYFAAFVLCNDNFQQSLLQNINSNQVAEWEEVFDHVYNEDENIEAIESNFQGWIDSCTNEPIPNEDMHLWLHEATDLIESYKPDSILEIGCGTGLLLFQLAPKVDQYVGTDISSNSIEYVKTGLDLHQEWSSGVTLYKKPAHDLTGFDNESFDCIIINSVVQYFPDIEYLNSVIQEAVRVVRPGGKVFIGDIRSKPLLEHFHFSVQNAKADETLSIQEFKEICQNQFENDKELLVHPHYFLSLNQEVPEISHVEIIPKEGKYVNELSKYRYQSIIHVSKGDKNKDHEVTWLKHSEISEDIIEKINGAEEEVFGISGVPNHMLHKEEKALQLIETDDLNIKTVGELRDKIASEDDLENLWGRVTKEKPNLPYAAFRFWARHDVSGQFDILFIRKDKIEKYNPGAVYYTEIRKLLKLERLALSRYANHPVKAKVFEELVPELRNFLKDRLPEHMIPTIFLPITEVPLTTSGKVNKKALVVDTGERVGVSTAYMKPRNSAEEQMIEIWKEVLGRERVGVQDNFFELGGHSLKAVQLVSRIHKELNYKIDLRTVFASPTIENLLEHLQKCVKDTYKPLEAIGIQEHYELSHAQRRLWLLNEFDDNITAYNMSGAYKISGKFNPDAFEKAFKYLIERHESLRTSFVYVDNEPKQSIHNYEDILFYIRRFDISDETDKDQEVKKLIEEEMGQSFDLSEAPLIRAKLITLASDEHVFLINMHHIISDGWSLRIIAKEIFTLYNAFINEKQISLPELKIQYKDFAAWQNNYLNEGNIKGDYEYWKNELTDIPTLELNTDFSRPSIRTFNGGLVNDQLDAQVLTQLIKISNENDCTLFMTLISCINALFYRYTGQEDVVIGSPIAGRNHKDLEGLVGFFINMLVLRTKFDATSSFRDLLMQVKETVLGAYDHQEYPFDKLVEEFGGDRDHSRSPFFDVNVVLQNTDLAQFELLNPLSEDGIKIHPFGVDLKVSKFDLIFDFREFQGMLLIEVEYNKDIFKKERIETMILHFKELINSIIEDSSRPLNRLNYLTEQEKNKILLLAQGK